jgi:hypothetical protein
MGRKFAREKYGHFMRANMKSESPAIITMRIALGA